MSLLADMIFEQMQAMSARMLGTEWGRVEDVEDPHGLGRVRVKLPWHKEGEASAWLPRQTGAGNGYGESGSIPQPGELVVVHFDRGDGHRSTYTPAVWTQGGMNTAGNMPPSLPPHHDTQSGLFSQPLHKPEDGKFKVWYDKTLSGWTKWVGEGLDWLQFKSPKGFDFRIEHDVPVGGKSKDDAVSDTPYHKMSVTTPTGHQITVLEHQPAGQNDITIHHNEGMSFEMLSRQSQRSLRIAIDGYTVEVSKGDLNGIKITDEQGQFVELSPERGLHSKAALVYEDAQAVMLGQGASLPVARVGDKVQIIGVQPGTATLIATIISGSEVVKSA